jgi:histone-lysine N-methyltransferase SETMAR
MAVAKLEQMEHPPYSPDLAPCDFFLFGSVKGKLAGKRYATRDDLVSKVRRFIAGIRPDFLKRVFESLQGRLLYCWNCGDEFVE